MRLYKRDDTIYVKEIWGSQIIYADAQKDGADTAEKDDLVAEADKGETEEMPTA